MGVSIKQFFILRKINIASERGFSRRPLGDSRNELTSKKASHTSSQKGQEICRISPRTRRLSFRDREDSAGAAETRHQRRRGLRILPLVRKQVLVNKGTQEYLKLSLIEFVQSHGVTGICDRRLLL